MCATCWTASTVVRTDAAAGARPGLNHPAAADFVAAVGGGAEAQIRLDRRRPLQRVRHSGGQLRPGDALLAHTDNEHVPAAGYP